MNRNVSMWIVVCRSAYNGRHVVGMILIVTLVVGVLFPAPVYAQFGLLSGIENILNIINGGIRSALNLIGAVSQSLQILYQQIVWPVQLIHHAWNVVTSLIGQFRGTMNSILTVSISSATLPAPVALDSIIRDRQTTDTSNVSESYYQTLGALPSADESDTLARDTMDIDDTLALDTLKTLKAMDQASEVVLESSNGFEDDAKVAAPGSAPFLTAAAAVANLQSQAMMQRMLAAMLRQEAAWVAHENTLRKRNSIIAAKTRQNIENVLRRP